jgi:hypothetical protein
MIVDEAKVRPVAHGADMPGHLHRKKQRADNRDDRHPADEVARPAVKRRMLGIEHGERHDERQRGQEMECDDEGREQRDRPHVVLTDVPEKPVHTHD